MKWIPSSAQVPSGVLTDFISRSWLLLFARAAHIGVVFFIFWLYSLRLTREFYGTYQKIFVLIGFCSSLLGLGMPLLISSLPKEQAGQLVIAILKKKRWIYVVSLAAVTTFLCSKFSLLPFAAGVLCLLLCVIAAIYRILEILLIKNGNDKIIFGINLVYTFLFASAHLWILFRPAFPLITLLILLVVVGLCRLFFVWRLDRQSFQKQSREAAAVPAQLQKTYTRQWSFLSLNEILDNFSANIDNFFLLWLLSSAGFAIYFNGSYEIPLTGLLISVAGTFINVQIRKYHLTNESIVHLFHSVCLLLSFILFPLFFFLQLHAGSIFSWLFHGKYDDSIPIFLISTWIIPLRIIHYTAILQDKLKSNIILYGSILGLTLKALLCFLLYRYLGVPGVAAAVVIGTAIQMGYYLYHSSVHLKIAVGRIMPFGQLSGFFLASGILSWLGKSLTASMATPYRLCTGILILLLTAGTALYLFYRKLLPSKL